jgi:hypothetical protein
MRAWLSTLVAAVALALPLQLSADSPAEILTKRLVGRWLVVVEGESRTRTLEVRKIKQETDGSSVVDAAYGWSDGKLGKASLEAAVRDGRVEITLTTGPGNVLTASEVMDERLDGVFTYTKSGKTKAASLEYTGAVQPRPRYGLKPESVVTVVYVGAADCPTCRFWEIGEGHTFSKSPEAKVVRMREVHASTYRDTSSGWPADLTWVRDKAKVSSGTPRWLIVIDDRIVLNSRGLNGWTAEVHPLLKDIAAQRTR